MRSIQRAKIAYISYSAALILLGALFIHFSDISLVVISRLIGGVVLACGVVKFIDYFVNDTYGLAFQFDFALGIFTMLIGLVLLLHPMGTLAFLNVILGVFVMIDGNFKLQTAKEAKHFGMKSWWMIAILAICTTLAGVLLLCNPFKGIAAMSVLIGVALLIYGIENLYVAACTVQMVHRFRGAPGEKVIETKGEEKP